MCIYSARLGPSAPDSTQATVSTSLVSLISCLQLGWWKSNPQLKSTEASEDPENFASCRVLEKCGLTNEGNKKEAYSFPNIADCLVDKYLLGWIRPRSETPKHGL